MVYKLRNDIAPFVFKKNKLDYQPNTDRSTIQDFVDAIYHPNKTRFSKFAPILYPDREFNNDTLFRSKELTLVSLYIHIFYIQYKYISNAGFLKMLHGILFGSSSLFNNAKKQPSPKSQGLIWGIKHTTPGAIALVATLVYISLILQYIVIDIGTSIRQFFFTQVTKLLNLLALFQISHIAKFLTCTSPSLSAIALMMTQSQKSYLISTIVSYLEH